jgi:hypothetical protein
MDPYLEAPALWGGVHTRLITAIGDDLADRLAPRFIVDIETRVYIVTSDEPTRRPIVPDVYVVRGPRDGAGGGAAAVITPPRLVQPLFDLEVRERAVTIRDAANREVVAAIEVLSPFNKTAGSAGREAFLRKRQAVLASPAAWIEVDLLRAGERPAEVSGQSDYYALLHRGGVTDAFEVWPIDLRDRLPTIAVPLRPPEDDAPLDLQALLDGVYRRGHYADSLDYAAAPAPPRLRPADAAWAEGRVREWSARRAGAG